MGTYVLSNCALEDFGGVREELLEALIVEDLALLLLGQVGDFLERRRLLLLDLNVRVTSWIAHRNVRFITTCRIRELGGRPWIRPRAVSEHTEFRLWAHALTEHSETGPTRMLVSEQSEAGIRALRSLDPSALKPVPESEASIGHLEPRLRSRRPISEHSKAGIFAFGSRCPSPRKVNPRKDSSADPVDVPPSSAACRGACWAGSWRSPAPATRRSRCRVGGA